MYKIVLIFLFIFTFIIPSKADQLSYLSKKEAEKGCSVINKLDSVYLFCGCCDENVIEVARRVKVEVKFTGHESYYEIILTYTDKNDSIQTMGIDLAYVWSKKNKKLQTIGQILKLEHDPCRSLWNVKTF
jgi:hypothetical protein